MESFFILVMARRQSQIGDRSYANGIVDPQPNGRAERACVRLDQARVVLGFYLRFVACDDGFPLRFEAANVDDDVRLRAKGLGGRIVIKVTDGVGSQIAKLRQTAEASQAGGVADAAANSDMVGMLIFIRTRSKHDFGLFAPDLTGNGNGSFGRVTDVAVAAYIQEGELGADQAGGFP